MKIVFLLFIVSCWGVLAQERLIERVLQNVENQLRGPIPSLSRPTGPTGPTGPTYHTMVIYNKIMRQYYEVVKRYYDYKNRNMSTVGIKNPEFHYFEEVLSKMTSSELRVLMGQFGQFGQGGLLGG